MQYGASRKRRPFFLSTNSLVLQKLHLVRRNVAAIGTCCHVIKIGELLAEDNEFHCVRSGILRQFIDQFAVPEDT